MTPVLQSSRPPPSSTVFLSSCLPAIGRGQEGDGRLSQSGTSPGLPLTKADSGKNPQSTERDTEITPEVQDSLHSSQSLTALQLAVVSAVIRRYSHWYQQRYSDTASCDISSDTATGISDTASTGEGQTLTCSARHRLGAHGHMLPNTLHTLQGAVCSVQCAVFSVQCAVWRVRSAV